MRKISFCEIWSFWSLFSRAPTKTFSLELFHVTYYKECDTVEPVLSGTVLSGHRLLSGRSFKVPKIASLDLLLFRPQLSGHLY